jgi:hypothetical protein
MKDVGAAGIDAPRFNRDDDEPPDGSFLNRHRLIALTNE